MKFILRTCVFLAVSVPVLSTAKVPQNSVSRGNRVALRGGCDAKMGAPMAARALTIVHTCMYDAWAAYDEKAAGTQLSGALRRPANRKRQRRQLRYHKLAGPFPHLARPGGNPK
ncbi:MAG: DUF6851 domain-containing protein [Candidatus Acidiferrum sp.]